MSVHPGPETEGPSPAPARGLVAAPTLTVVVKWSDVLDADLEAPAGASPAPADIFDLSDAH